MKGVTTVLKKVIIAVTVIHANIRLGFSCLVLVMYATKFHFKKRIMKTLLTHLPPGYEQDLSENGQRQKEACLFNDSTNHSLRQPNR